MCAQSVTHQHGHAIVRATISVLLCTGVNVVSPQWVLRSAKLGSLQKLVAMSMDASRRLPADGAAQHSRAAGAASTAEATRQSAEGAATLAAVGKDRAERDALLARLLREKVDYSRQLDTCCSQTLRLPVVSCTPAAPATQ